MTKKGDINAGDVEAVGDVDAVSDTGDEGDVGDVGVLVQSEPPPAGSSLRHQEMAVSKALEDPFLSE